MTTCRDIIGFLEKLAPVELAEEWDNVGLLVGTGEREIGKIMLCLDITAASIKEAVSGGADMIVTHHPVIFKGLKRLIEEDAKGKLLYELMRNGICVYAAHTNLDFADSGVNTCLAEALGLHDLEPLGKGPGKTGYLEKPTSLEEYIELVKKALTVSRVRVAGKRTKPVRKVAVFSGSFDDDLEVVKQSGADLLVTGDLKYHTALDAVEAGICIIDAGHFNTEKIVLPPVAGLLRAQFPGTDVFCFDLEEDPFKTY
jgi:dinuclear metal center YbgI/SA1388 family protein